ncbi:MAG: hypothetical protein JKY37_19205 [Nannocystaceae bacterium]|nr:hypothetical protein [Nannocystaceae bacterium]
MHSIWRSWGSPRFSLLVLFAGLQVGGCGDKAVPVVSGSPAGDGAERHGTDSLPEQRAGPKRYEISSDGRLLGVALQGSDGRFAFTAERDLPLPCFADDFEKNWTAYPQPETVHLETGGVTADGTRWHGAQAVKRGAQLYPYAMLNAFLANDFHTEPRLPRSLEAEDGSKPKPPSRFVVSAHPSRRETPDNFTPLPVGVFTVGSDGAVSLETACEGEYLAGRLAEHFGQDEILLPFAEPSGKWAAFKARSPGDLRLTTEKFADVKVRYRRGEPEFFAALMVIVDHQFDVSLDVKPEPVLAASALHR